MPELSQREKSLIFIMLLLVGVFLLVIIVQKLHHYETQLSQQLLTKQTQLHKLQKLEKDWQRWKAFPTSPVMTQPLTTYVENAARGLKLQDYLQLNALNNAPEGTEGVQVRLNQLELDQLFGLLLLLEGNKPVLLVEQLEISVIPSSRLLRASFRVLKRKP